MSHLGYDTETTGLFGKGWMLSDPRNPHIVQLAAVLFTLQGARLGEMNRIIKPDGWTIDQGAQDAHGISIERANDEGVPFLEAVEEFEALAVKAEHRVAHNEEFDKRLLDIDYYKYGRDRTVWASLMPHCTMKMSKSICKIPPTAKMRAVGFNTYKNPKLSEAYKHFTGEELVGAHDAMNDVNGVITIFLKMIGSDNQVTT